ncbi:hypothetical protein R3X25_02345 [Lutibacter sp. TH_r2]|uniref:hypothetical protein n=1 Tax=Lutibacter sp. TH_r2 TaxID=3082083 RepID=UPI0029531D1F|nr:hypothetical protein [Lutibacter sp. TH_r2]MDV7186109.1 hypothetical protein [Lutibacter sp. TH_r2]
MKLVTWIISQKLDPTCSLSNETLNELIQTLKKTNEHMPLYIVVEFDKVLADLLRVIQEHPSTRSFYFCGTAFTKPTFNYKKLMDYISAI